MKPEISHYFGRPVMAVTTHKKDGWDWTIELEGNVLLRNTDKRRTSAPDVEGLALTGQTDADTLLFTNVEVSITPDKFVISAPGTSDPDEVEEDPLPPDPSPERVAEGPERPSKGTDE